MHKWSKQIQRSSRRFLPGCSRTATSRNAPPSNHWCQLGWVPLWKQAKRWAHSRNLEVEVDRALPKWINMLVADKSNRTKIFEDHPRLSSRPSPSGCPHRWGYQQLERGRAQHQEAGQLCLCLVLREWSRATCPSHSVRVQFWNPPEDKLVTLCRICHEKEHERVFDFGENMQTPDVPH